MIKRMAVIATILGDAAEIIAAVGGGETLFGHVDAAAVTGDMKILLTIP